MKNALISFVSTLFLLGCNGNAQQVKNRKMKSKIHEYKNDNNKSMSKLIYVMDPLCGWCYGNSTTTQKLFEKYNDKFDFEILPAGMWVGANVRSQSKPIAAFIKRHDPEVQETTGTEFGSAYFKFIDNESIILDSEVPSRAIVTVKKMNISVSVPFAIEVQKARYWFGKDLNDEATYLTICDSLGLDKAIFLALFHSDSIKRETQETFELARQYATSYPTLLAIKEDKVHVLEQGYQSFDAIELEISRLNLLN